MTASIQHFGRVFSALLVGAATLAAWPFLRERADFSALPDTMVTVELKPVKMGSPDGWTLYGAWTLKADDPRLAGLSGLGCAPLSPLDIVTDMGSRIAMPFPGTESTRLSALIGQLPGVRDAEAIGYLGPATLVAEEIWRRLWVFEPGLPARALPLPPRDGYANWGVEAILDPGGETEEPILFEELADVAYRIGEGEPETIRVEGASKRITGAARHPDGRAILLLRRLGPLGFTSAVASAEVHADRVTVGPPIALPLPRNANPEGICVEPREAGLTRLWIVTDDNGLGILSQRLVGWDVPDAAWPTAP